MGFFDILKSAFSASPSQPADEGIYVHVKLDRNDEVVRIRLNPGQELNPSDRGYSCRKSIVGPRTFRKADALFHFDSSKHLIEAEIEGGEMVDESIWRAYEAARESQGGGAGFG